MVTLEDVTYKHPWMRYTSLNKVREAYVEGKLTREELHAWLPVWCVGKWTFKYERGVLLQKNPVTGSWSPASWAN